MLGKQVALLCLSASAAWAGSISSGLSQRSPPNLKSLLVTPTLKWCSGTQVFFPGQPNYANLTTQRWSSYEEPSYLASVKPACAQDVITIVSPILRPRFLGFLRDRSTNRFFPVGEALCGEQRSIPFDRWWSFIQHQSGKTAERT